MSGGGLWVLKSGGLVGEVVVEYDHCCHGLDNGYCSGQHAGVVASLGFEDNWFALFVDGMLVAQQGCYWFECYSEVDVLSVGYAALYAAAVVGLCGDTAAGCWNEDVVLLAASSAAASEP